MDETQINKVNELIKEEQEKSSRLLVLTKILRKAIGILIVSGSLSGSVYLANTLYFQTSSEFVFELITIIFIISAAGMVAIDFGKSKTSNPIMFGVSIITAIMISIVAYILMSSQ